MGAAAHRLQGNAKKSPRAAQDGRAARLVERLKQGDPDAFDELYQLYLTPLYGYMVVALHDHHEAEDAAHEVFVKMLLALPRYELRGVPFRAWLFRIARNHLLDRMQQLRRVDPGNPEQVRRLLDDGLGEGEAATGLRDLSDTEFLRVIQFLPLLQRQVLVLRYVFDLSFGEIGIALGITEASARNLQRRAFAKLRPRLAPERAPSETRVARLAMRLLPAPAPVLSARLRALA